MPIEKTLLSCGIRFVVCWRLVVPALLFNPSIYLVMETYILTGIDGDIRYFDERGLIEVAQLMHHENEQDSIPKHPNNLEQSKHYINNYCDGVTLSHS